MFKCTVYSAIILFIAAKDVMQLKDSEHYEIFPTEDESSQCYLTNDEDDTQEINLKPNEELL